MPPTPKPLGFALCRKCGTRLDPLWKDEGFHPTCVPEGEAVPVAISEPGGKDPFSEKLRQDITEIVEWADANSARTKQLAVGPSELGHACDRYLAYRIAGWPAVNTKTDPWPAIVGTAVHAWMEQAVVSFQQELAQKQDRTASQRFITEATVWPDRLGPGHCDLFDTWTNTVIDYKTKSPRKVKLWQQHGPTEKEIDQVNVYGLGYVNAGHQVDRVALVCIPRSGWLDDFEVWSGPYDESGARRALTRRDTIGYKLIELDIMNNPHRFQQVDASPERSQCMWCPFHRRDSFDGEGAGAKGCPGK